MGWTMAGGGDSNEGGENLTLWKATVAKKWGGSGVIINGIEGRTDGT